MSVIVDKSQGKAILVKHCPKCKATKPIAAFHQDRTRFDLLAPYCAACKNAMWNARYRVKTGGNP